MPASSFASARAAERFSSPNPAIAAFSALTATYRALLFRKRERPDKGQDVVCRCRSDGIGDKSLNDTVVVLEWTFSPPDYFEEAIKLTLSTMTRLHQGGPKDYFMDAERAHFVIMGDTVECQVINGNGSVIADSKQDRIGEKRRFAELVASWRVRDTQLASVLGSYKAAIEDRNNELVHLYEIRRWDLC